MGAGMNATPTTAQAATVPAYSATARILHWMTAALVLALVPLGFVIANEWGGAQQERLYDLHKSLGALMVPLILVRLLTRFVSPPLPLPDDIPAIQQFAAHVTHWALYVLLLGPGADRLDRHVGLSGAGAVLRLVQPAGAMVREPGALRSVDGAASLVWNRHRCHRHGSYRGRPSSSFRAQGPCPDAYADRLMRTSESGR